MNRGGRQRVATPVFLLGGAVILGLAGAVGWAQRRFSRIEVSGASMSPTLDDGDFVIVDQHAYRRRAPAIGDIVLLRDPRVPDRELVKRVARIDAVRGIWVEGDNPEASTDSRDFGWIAPESIAGRVVARYWPKPLRIPSAASFSSTSASVGNASGGGSDGST